MADSGDNAARRLRADGRRNRARILEAANRLLSEKGASASLDEIALAARVGNGTMYRHFPTRAALVAAVCREDTRELIEAAATLSACCAPGDALTQWLHLFVDYISGKNVIVEAVAAMVSDKADVTGSGADIRAALGRLYGACAGPASPALEPSDLLRALSDIGIIAPEPDWEQGARQLVRVLIAGLRLQPRPAAAKQTGADHRQLP